MNKNILLTLLLFIGFINASSSSLTLNFTPILIALLISLGIAGILFLISKLTQSPHTEAWAKTEIFEVFVTILIALIISFFMFTSNILPAITGHGDSYKDITIGYLETQRSDSINTFYVLSRTNFILTKYSAFSYSKTSSIPFVDWLYTEFESRSQNFGLGPLVSKFNKSFESLGQAIFLLTAQKIILQYLLYSIPIFFLPLGLVLRAFPFTRKFGTIILALCIAGYFVFPLSVVFAGEVYKSVLPDEVINNQLTIIQTKSAEIDPGDIPFKGLICSPVSAAIAVLGQFGFIVVTCAAICAIGLIFFGAGFAACYAACKPIAEIIYYVAVPFFQYTYGERLAGWAIMEGAVFDTTYNLIMDIILPLVTLQWLLAIITPLIAILLTIVSLNSIQTALGADIRIFGLSRLI